MNQAEELLRGVPTFHGCALCTLSGNATYEAHASVKVGQVTVCSNCHVVAPLFLSQLLSALVKSGFNIVEAANAQYQEDPSSFTGLRGLQRREIPDSALDITNIRLYNRHHFMEVKLQYSQSGKNNPDLIAALSDLTVESFTGPSYGLERGPEAYAQAVAAFGVAGFKALPGDYSRTTCIKFLRGDLGTDPASTRGVRAELSYLP